MSQTTTETAFGMASFAVERSRTRLTKHCTADTRPVVPGLLRIPPEIRVMIYGYLLDFDDAIIPIRNKPRRKSGSAAVAFETGLKTCRRSVYYVLEKTLMRPSYKTTYCLEPNEERQPCAAILAVNKRIYEEASHYLYAKHGVDFNSDIEAVSPFINDRTRHGRDLITNITLRRRNSFGPIDAGSSDWPAACRSLRRLPNLRRLRIIVEGGRPRAPWDGPRELSVSDLKLLYATRHASLEWVRDLAEMAGELGDVLEEVELVAEEQYMPEPRTTGTLIYAALSASIETSLVEFLRGELAVPAISRPGEDSLDELKLGPNRCNPS